MTKYIYNQHWFCLSAIFLIYFPFTLLILEVFSRILICCISMSKPESKELAVDEDC